MMANTTAKKPKLDLGRLVWVREGKASYLAHLVLNGEEKEGKLCIQWQQRRDVVYVDADVIGYLFMEKVSLSTCLKVKSHLV